MKKPFTLLIALGLLLVAGCATTEYKSFEGKTNVISTLPPNTTSC